MFHINTVVGGAANNVIITHEENVVLHVYTDNLFSSFHLGHTLVPLAIHTDL